MPTLTNPSLTTSRLADLALTRLSDKVLRWGQSCSATTPVNIQLGDTVYAFTAPITITLTAGTSGSIRTYIKSDGTQGIAATSGITLSVSGGTLVTSNSFPTGSIQHCTWSVTSSNFASSGTDERAFIGSASTGSSGAAGGDLSGTYPNPGVATVGGATAANIATSVTDTTTATNANTVSKIVKRDGSGNFAAGTITANLTGNASGTAATFTGSLTGDVTSTAMATTLATSGVTAGTYGSTTKAPVIVIDAKGRVTSASEATIIAGVGGSTGFDVTKTSTTLLTVSSGTARVGSKVYAVSSGTVTVSGSGNGTYYVYVDSANGALTIGHNAATPTLVGSGVTVNAAITDYPVDSIPIYTVTVLTAQWDVLTDKRASQTVSRLLEAGTNVTFTVTSDKTVINSSGGGSGFDASNPNYHFRCGRSSIWVPTIDYGYGTVTNGGYKLATGTDSLAGLGTSSGSTLVHMRVPGNDNNWPNVLNAKYSITIRCGKIGASNDHYVGIGGVSGTSATVIADGVFAKWNNSASKWQLVVRNGGADSGTAVDMTGAPNDSATHNFTFSNNGTTNRVSCQIDNGTVYTNTSGTISNDFTGGNGVAGCITTTGAGIWLNEYRIFIDRS